MDRIFGMAGAKQIMTAQRKARISAIVALSILLVAAAVRFHQLGEQSFWYDEGVAYRHSLRTLPELIEALQNNVHVPAYFGLLGLWEDFVGQSEFALRALSTLLSILSVALTYALGKRLFHPIAGLAAAAFVALNTFSIYYAQETRMYAMLAAVGAASMWVFIDFWKRPDFRRGLALALLNALGLYTHYSYPLVMIAQGFLALFWLAGMFYDSLSVRGWRRSFEQIKTPLIAYITANLLTVILFLPWLPTALTSITAQPNISEPTSLDVMLRLLQGWFAFGSTFEDSMGSIGVAVYFFLMFGLLILPPQQRRPHATWRMLLPVVWVIVAALFYILLELTTRYLRFLIPAQIGFALWMGRGVWVLWTLQTRERSGMIRHLPKFTAAFAAMVLLLNLANGLPLLYDDPRYQRDNYRALAAEIEAELREGDAVILSAAGLSEIFGYYYRGAAPVYPLPTSRDPAEIRADTEAVIVESGRVFAVFYGTAEQDPDGIVEKTLNEQAYPVSDVWRGDVRLVRYVMPAELGAPVESGAQFGDFITLAQYQLSSSEARPGELLQLRLNWSTSAILTAPYKVFVQLLMPDGTLATQRDSEPNGGLSPTMTWQPGEIVSDAHALILPDNLAPGDYSLIVGLYPPDDPFARLPVGENDHLLISRIRVR